MSTLLSPCHSDLSQGSRVSSLLPRPLSILALSGSPPGFVCVQIRVSSELDTPPEQRKAELSGALHGALSPLFFC